LQAIGRHLSRVCRGETREIAELDRTLTIQAFAGGLRIVQEHPLQSGPPFVLPPFNPLGDDFFACDAAAEMQFLRDASGEVVGLRLDVNRATGLELVRR